MTVRELKQQLIGIPDDAIIVVPGRDHSYRAAGLDLTQAVKKGPWLWEYWNKVPLEDGETMVPVLVVL